MTKNEKIKQSHKETHLKRKTQYLKVFELKVNCHHTSKEDFQKLNDCFRQAKWVINDVIGSNDIFNYNYKDHRREKENLLGIKEKRCRKNIERKILILIN